MTESEIYGLKLSRVVLPSDGSRVRSAGPARSAQPGPQPSAERGRPEPRLDRYRRVPRPARLGDHRRAATTGPRRATSVAVRPVDVARPRGGDRRARRAVRDNRRPGVVASMFGFSRSAPGTAIVLFIAFFSMVQVAIWARAAGGLGPAPVPARRRGRRWPRWPSSPWSPRSRSVRRCGGSIRRGRRQPMAERPGLRRPDRAEHAPRRLVGVPAPGDAVPRGDRARSMHDYDPLRAYLADNGKLRWSYGAVKGRPDADWQLELPPRRARRRLPGLLAWASPGSGSTRTATSPTTARQTPADRRRSAQPMVSPDNRFRFYDLRPYKARLGQSDEQLRAIARRQFKVVPPPERARIRVDRDRSVQTRRPRRLGRGDRGRARAARPWRRADTTGVEPRAARPTPHVEAPATPRRAPPRRRAVAAGDRRAPGPARPTLTGRRGGHGRRGGSGQRRRLGLPGLSGSTRPPDCWAGGRRLGPLVAWLYRVWDATDGAAAGHRRR